MTKKMGCMVVVGFIVVLAVLAILGSESDQEREIERADPGAKTRVEIEPDSVILNFRNGRLTIVASLPDTLFDSTGTAFLWAYFTNPSFNDGSWSDFPIRVQRNGSSERVRAIYEGFGFWNNSAVPDSGFLARVFAGRDSAMLPQFSLVRDKGPVRGRRVVHIERR